MTVVNHTLINEAGEPISNAYVEIQTLAPSAIDNAYFDSAQIIGRKVTRTDSEGTWSLDLIPNSAITPGGTTYKVIHGVPGWVANQEAFFIVPESPNPSNLTDLLTVQPSDIPVSARLVAFDPQGSGMSSSNVEDAILEAFTNGGGGGGESAVTWLHHGAMTDSDVTLATIGPFTLTAHIEGGTTVQYVLTCSMDGSLVNDYDSGAGEGTSAFRFDGDHTSIVLGYSSELTSDPYNYNGPYDGTFSALAADYSLWITGSITTAVIGGDGGEPQAVWSGRIWTAPVSGGGGGGSFPTYYQQDAPVDPADGDTWMRVASNNGPTTYPNSFGIGTFRWDAAANNWNPISPVALDSDGNVLGIMSIGQDGNIVLERFTGDPSPTMTAGLAITQNGTFLFASPGAEIQLQGENGIIRLNDAQVEMRVDSGIATHSVTVLDWTSCIDGVTTEGLIAIKLFRGNWNGYTWYNVGELVRGWDGNTYIAQQSSNGAQYNPVYSDAAFFAVNNSYPPVAIKSLIVDWGGIEIDPATWGASDQAGIGVPGFGSGWYYYSPGQNRAWRNDGSDSVPSWTEVPVEFSGGSAPSNIAHSDGDIYVQTNTSIWLGGPGGDNDWSDLLTLTLPWADATPSDPVSAWGLNAPPGSFYMNNRIMNSTGSFHIKTGLTATAWRDFTTPTTDVGYVQTLAYNTTTDIVYARVDTAPTSYYGWMPGPATSSAPAHASDWAPLNLLDAGQAVTVRIDYGNLNSAFGTWDAVDIAGRILVWSNDGSNLIEAAWNSSGNYTSSLTYPSLSMIQQIGTDLSIVDATIVSASGGSYNVQVKTTDTEWD